MITQNIKVMHILKYTSLFLFIIICSYFTLNAQTAYTEVYPNYKVAIEKEKLDVKQYAGKYKGSILDYTYIKDDGSKVQLKSYSRNSEIEVFEFPPAPAIHIIYKVFYANGNLKEKGVFLPNQLKIGKWIECNNNGDCTITDVETGRNVVYGYNNVLEYMEQENYYLNTNGNEWKCTFWHTPSSHTWGVRVDKNGQQYKMYTFDDKGEREVIENSADTSASKPVPVIGTFEQKE